MRFPHLAWGALGAAAAASMWFAYTIPGAIGLFLAIALAFVMWKRLGPRGSWMALIVMGLSMSGVLGWQAATGSRCPPAGTKVFLKEGKPPVSCDEIRASAGSMSVFFGLIALLGVGAPFYARRLDDERAGPLHDDG